MSYLNKEGALHLKVATSLIDLTAAAVASNSYLVGRSCDVGRLQVVVHTATVSTGGIVVKFWKRVTPGSSSGQIALGTITLPTGLAAGAVYYNDISPVALQPGDEIAFEVTTAAAGGSAAGKCVAMPVVAERSEAAANCSHMVSVTA